MLYINPENKSLLFFPIHTHIQVNHLYCGQACQTGVLLERWQSLAAKLDTFHILFFFSTIPWIPFRYQIFSTKKIFGFLYQGCEVGVDIEETELRLDRLELTLPLWLCEA